MSATDNRSQEGWVFVMSLRTVLFATTMLVVVGAGGLAQAAEADDSAIAAAVVEDADEGVTVSTLEVEGQLSKESAGATGLPLTLRETPQSVTVIPREQIEDFALVNINQLLGQAIGVNVERVETDRTYFNARGFDITSFQVDGVGLPMIWGIQFGDLDTAIFDRVDIVRGANGMMTGVGNPSATINYIRKRPTTEFEGRLSASYGSWNDRRLEADISGPLNASGTVRGRIVGALTDSDSYLDFYGVERNVFYGVLAWDAAPGLTFSAGWSRQDNQADGVLWGALPLTSSDGTRVAYDRSASTSADWTYWNTLDEQVFVDALYAPGDGWSLKATLTHKVFEEEAKLLYAYGHPDPVTGLGVFGMSGIYPSRYEQTLFDASLTGKVSLGGREHRVVLGGALAHGTGVEYENFSGDTIVYPSVSDWGRLAIAEPTYPGAYKSADGEDTLKRVYAAVHLDLADSVKAVVGVNAIDLQSDGFSYGSPLFRDESKVSPYVGLVWDLTANLSLYASYTDIFNPQSEIDLNRQPLPAVQGRSWEAGVKSEWLGGRLYATASAFRVEQLGLASWAGYIPGTFDAWYTPLDTVSEGYELEFAGRVTDRWQISGGWTHLTKLEDETGAEARRFLPRKTLKIATTWSVPELRDLKLGAALRWQSEIGMQDLAWIEQDSYAVVDVMAGFDVTDSVRATVNVRNLFDETYLSSLMWSQSYHAAPRSASVTLKYSF